MGRPPDGRPASGDGLAPDCAAGDDDDAEDDGTEQGSGTRQAAHDTPPRDGRRAGGGRAPRDGVCRSTAYRGLIGRVHPGRATGQP